MSDRPGAAPPIPRPLLARLTAPAGPPQLRRLRRADAEVVAVPGRYSVTYLVLAGEAVGIVDVGSSGDIPRLLAALRWLGRPAAQVRWVLPTHLHFDHLLGVDPLALCLGAPVALGAAGVRQVRGEVTPRWAQRRHLLRAVPTWIYQGMPFPTRADWRAVRDFGVPGAANPFAAPLLELPAAPAPLPDFPGWQLLPTPGHADDAVCLYHAAAGFLIAGDTVRNFVGGEWNPLLCSSSDYARTRAELCALPVETIFPAHGPILQGQGIMDRLRMLPWYAP